MKKNIATHSIYFTLSLILGTAAAHPLTIRLSSLPAKEALGERPDTAIIEKELFNLMNSARKEKGVPPLACSPELSALARRQSRDMADRGELSNLSSSGLTYTRRLAQEGMSFARIGENVAFSETFLAGLIHQDLMVKPDMRANILDPSFDTAGVGVVHEAGRGYFITQDLIQSLPLFDVGEVEARVRKQVDEARQAKGLSPLRFTQKANEFARGFSQKKAAGEAPPSVGDELGRTVAHIIITPLPLEVQDWGERVSGFLFEEAGVGAWLGKSDAYPGGAYFLTLLLLARSPYEDVLEEDIARTVFEEVNAKRREKKVAPLRFDKRLSLEAAKTSRLMKAQGTVQATSRAPVKRKVFYNFLMLDRVMTYLTEDPRSWPAGEDENLMSPLADRIGIGVSFTVESGTRREFFWVSVILRFPGSRR